MAKKPWARSDRLMRALHLYTSMFLVPWMTVYAISAFMLNHSEWFTEKLQLRPDWEVVRERDTPSRPNTSGTSFTTLFLTLGDAR